MYTDKNALIAYYITLHKLLSVR